MTMDGRPPTSAGNRPISGVRPFTTTRQNTLGMPTHSNAPGTASRLITTPSNRPGTRSGVAQGIGVLSHINVVDRPMSQQGLVTPRTGVRAPRRQIQDKSYFMGLLRSKINELSSEIMRLTKEVDYLTKEQSTYLTYEKRAESQANELKNLQGLLADYNLLVDKLNTDAEMADVQEEYKDLKIQNEREAESIERLFEEKQAKEAQLYQLENEIKQERFMADNLISSMKPQLQEKYIELQRTSSNLQSALEKLQDKLDSLLSRKTSLEEELQMSQVKQEAVALYAKLRELEEKRDNLIQESKTKETPTEERERLLQQVKENNAELASIERQSSEAKEQLAKLKEELEQLEQDLEDHQGERISKYRELKKREETMDSFLMSFDENKLAECEKMSQLETAIVSLLEKNSRHLSQFHHLPSQQELSNLKDDLVFKEGEMEKSRMTAMTLNHEQKKLSLDLSKIEQLESKIQQELEMLQHKIETMEKEMIVYSDLDKLKVAAEEKKTRLVEEEKLLSKQQELTRKVVSETNTLYETLKNKLNDNETYIQLTNLERRWQHLEQNNFSMSEFVAAKKTETDYSIVKQNVKNMLADLNQKLQNSLSKR